MRAVYRIVLLYSCLSCLPSALIKGKHVDATKRQSAGFLLVNNAVALMSPAGALRLHVQQRRARRSWVLLRASLHASVSPRDEPTVNPPPAVGYVFAPGETMEFNIRGVSFEGRQDVVRGLRVGQPLLLIKDHENNVDASAVCVKRLDGSSCGFVPAPFVAHFSRRDTTLGRVFATGVNAAGLAWALGHTKPASPSLSAMLEAAGSPPPNLSSLGYAVWGRLRRRAYAEAGMRCEACGSVGNVNAGQNLVEANEVWLCDSRRRVYDLVGMECLCPACHSVRHLRTSSPAVRATLARVNAWSASEVEEYVKWVRDERSRRAALGGWSINAKWLSTRGFTDDIVLKAETRA